MMNVCCLSLDHDAALSDPTADGEPQQNAMERDRHSTRAVQLREQKTKAELVRMDSLVRKSDAPVYTSKKLVGVNTRYKAYPSRWFLCLFWCIGWCIKACLAQTD